jgi:hypothetical protein
MKKTADFETVHPVEPGMIRLFVVALHVEDNEDFCMLGVLCLDKPSSQSFQIEDLSWGYEDKLTSLISNSSVGLERCHLPEIRLPKRSYLLFKVKNITSLPQVFKGYIDFETISSEHSDSVVSTPDLSLIEKCKRWFKAGFEVAAMDRAAPSPATFRYPSVRDSVRSIVASLDDLVEIPTIAASLYWQHFTGEDGRHPATIGLVGIAASEVLSLIGVTIKVVPSRSFEPTKIYGTVGFELVSLRVAGREQLLSRDPIIFDEVLGISLDCEVAEAGSEIEVVVRKTAVAEDSVFRGILDGLVR